MTTDNNAPADDVVARLRKEQAISNAEGEWFSTIFEEAAAAIERLRAERDEVYEALSDLCDKHHCLPGVNQIEFLDNRLSRLTAAQLRIRELEDGLRPFAEHADLIGPSVEDDAVVAIFNSHEITVADLRRARALIERNSK